MTWDERMCGRSNHPGATPAAVRLRGRHRQACLACTPQQTNVSIAGDMCLSPRICRARGIPGGTVGAVSGGVSLRPRLLRSAGHALQQTAQRCCGIRVQHLVLQGLVQQAITAVRHAEESLSVS